MPPKTSTARGGAGKKKSVAAPADPMQELRDMEDVHTLLEKAQELRNYFQVERDKVNQMWDISKRELEQERDALQNCETELEEAVRDHEVEMKVYKQKVRHLIYDQKVAIQQLRTESDAAVQQLETAHESRMTSFDNERQSRHQGVESAKHKHESAIADEKENHAYMLTVIKQRNQEKEVARLRASYEAKMATLREDLELRRRAEVQDAEQRYHMHISKLIQQHEEKFKEMKDYYNSITRNNLEIIQSLKDEVTNMRKNEEDNETLLFEIEKENKNLLAPLEQAEKEVTELQLKKKQHLQNKQSLRMAQARAKALRMDIKKLRGEHEELEEKYKQVYEQRETIKGRFEYALREAMEVTEEHNGSLQQSLLEAHAMLEQRDAQLGGVLRAMNLEPSAAAMISDGIDEEVRAKNQIIKDLHFELRSLEKRTRMIMEEYERRCRTYGLPVPERMNIV